MPLGAIREKGRDEAARRYEMLKGEGLPAFHYGSHYSNSGVVAHFLIRVEPFTKYAVKL